MAYIYPCKTGGKCQQHLFESYGIPWRDSYPKNGVIGIWTDKGYGFDSFRGRYKCCTQCHLPLNQLEATKANKLLGNKLEEVVFDDEFMELLNGI